MNYYLPVCSMNNQNHYKWCMEDISVILLFFTNDYFFLLFCVIAYLPFKDIGSVCITLIKGDSIL